MKAEKERRSENKGEQLEWCREGYGERKKKGK